MNGDSHSGGRGDRDGRDRDSGRHGSGREHYRDDRRDRDRDRDRDRRRRSRSPGGHRSSRRDRDYEVDTYSSSRDYREREREDRYASRGDRNEDRGDGGRGDGGRAWDRDRGSRRDRPDRRDDRDDRRRDRDPYGDRRRGGHGGREREEKKRSPTPPPKKKEPTPDLTDIVSILEKKRRLTQWDIKPPGYENVTAEQAKLSGMFPLPGAPRQQAMDPTRLQAFMNQPGAAANAAALKPSNARQSKRLFVKNLPSSATDENLVEFFNLQLNGSNVVQGIDPCLSAQVSKESGFSMVEFRNPEDATLALALDGIEMESSTSNGAKNGAGNGLQISRPQDYIAPTPGDEDMDTGVLSNVVKDSPNKISITNIPVYITEDQIQELLKQFGTLKSFVLVKDLGSDQSRGIAFCEYTDPNTTVIAVESLNGLTLGEGALKVQRASVGIQQVTGLEMSVNAMSMLAGTQSADLQEGRVLQLLNMVTAEELIDTVEYEEIMEDVREECEKFGKVLELKIPRPSGTRSNPGVGKIFVKFDDTASAQKAMQALAGRKFADRTVVVTYFGEEYFDVNAW